MLNEGKEGPATVVFLHGVGGPEERGRWLGVLNRRLTTLDFPTLQAHTETFLEPEYLAALRSPDEDVVEPPKTWQKPEGKLYEQQKLDHFLRKQRMSHLLQSRSNQAGGIDLAFLPDGLLPTTVVDLLASDVRQYRTSSRHRHAVWQAVLAGLPKSGDLIIIAYSLGSVIAADLLDRLPLDVRVRLLLTVGSPLPIEGLRAHSRAIRDDFPYDRCQAWVNVLDPRDAVTCGRGISRNYSDALDVPVNTGTSHDVAAYCNHPAVAAAVASAVFGEVLDAELENVPAVRLSDSWNIPLLTFAYTWQVSATYSSAQWKSKMRFDAAREEMANRLLEAHDNGRPAAVTAPPSQPDLL